MTSTDRMNPIHIMKKFPAYGVLPASRWPPHEQRVNGRPGKTAARQASPLSGVPVLRQSVRIAGRAIASLLLSCAANSGCLAQNTTPRPEPVSIVQGTVGLVGGSSVGVVSVFRQPANALQASRAENVAEVSLDRYASDMPAEFTLPLREGNLIPLSDGLHRIERISEPFGATRGAVSIATNAVTRDPASGSVTVYLARGGRLRLNGPDTHHALDMDIDAWNATSPQPTADVRWRPAQFALEDTDARAIRRARLAPGAQLTIDGLVLTAIAIEPQTADHPAWIRFEVSRAR